MQMNNALDSFADTGLYFPDPDSAYRWAEETLTRPHYSTPLQIKRGNPLRAEDMQCLAHDISLDSYSIEPAVSGAIFRWMNTAYPRHEKMESIRLLINEKEQHLLFVALAHCQQEHIYRKGWPTKEIARCLGVSRQTFYTKIKDGVWLELIDRITEAYRVGRYSYGGLLQARGIIVGD